MRRLRAGWMSFRRIHLAALIADWRRTLLSVIGVALGVTVVLGVLVLKSELSRPFDSFGPSLTHAADIGVVEVTPNVSGRLPIETVNRLRAEVAGAQAVIPIVAGLTPVDVAGGSHGFFLLGGSCQIELLVGPFNCEQRARDVKPADGPGVPLRDARGHRPATWRTARRRIAHPRPATRFGAPRLDVPEFDRVEGINDGYVLLAPSTDVAATLLSSPGYVTAAFVLPRQGADVTADVDRVIAGVATAGPPRPHLPAVFANSTQSLNLTALAGIIVGILIAVNTVLLAVEDRRAVMGTIGAIGAKPVGPVRRDARRRRRGGSPRWIAGRAKRFPARRVSRGQIRAIHVGRVRRQHRRALHAQLDRDRRCRGDRLRNPCDVRACRQVGPRRAVGFDGERRRSAARQDDPDVAADRRGGVAGRRRRPAEDIRARVAAAEHGHQRLDGGAVRRGVGDGMDRPACRRAVERLLTNVRPAVGRLLGADIRRYTLLFGLSAALLAESTSLAIGSNSMQLLGTEQIAAQKADRLPAALLISAQSVLDQRDGRISDATFELVTGAADGRSVSSRWQSTISSGTLSRQVVGVTPGDWYSQATL